MREPIEVANDVQKAPGRAPMTVSERIALALWGAFDAFHSAQEVSR